MHNSNKFVLSQIQEKVSKNDEEYESLKSRCKLVEEKLKLKESGWQEAEAKLKDELQKSNARFQGTKMKNTDSHALV